MALVLVQMALVLQLVLPLVAQMAVQNTKAGLSIDFQHNSTAALGRMTDNTTSAVSSNMYQGDYCRMPFRTDRICNMTCNLG
jgi:hypothetical protein